MAPAITHVRSPRPPVAAASTLRRPCGKRSSSGPATGTSSANGSIVSSRYSATEVRASPSGTEKNSVPASATATSASPAADSACTVSSADSPLRSAPSARAAARTRRTAPRDTVLATGTTRGMRPS